MVVFQSSHKYEDIVKINYYDFFCYKILEDIIYYSLKHSRAIWYAKNITSGLKSP